MGLFGKKNEIGTTYTVPDKPPFDPSLPRDFQPHYVWVWVEGVVREVHGTHITTERFTELVEGIVYETEELFVQRMLPTCELEKQQEYSDLAKSGISNADGYRWIARNIPDSSKYAADIMGAVRSSLLRPSH